MTSAKWHTLRLSSRVCATCQNLGMLKARIADARRRARNISRVALNATDSAALQNLEEELKQTSTAYRLLSYAVDTHLNNQHSQTHGGRLAA